VLLNTYELTKRFFQWL